VAAVVGLIRLATGLAEPLGTLVNVAWVILDLVVMSILVRAVLYKGYEPVEDVDAGERKPHEV
jgi:cellulose synthase (UDP-forming)